MWFFPGERAFTPFTPFTYTPPPVVGGFCISGRRSVCMYRDPGVKGVKGSTSQFLPGKTGGLLPPTFSRAWGVKGVKAPRAAVLSEPPRPPAASQTTIAANSLFCIDPRLIPVRPGKFKLPGHLWGFNELAGISGVSKHVISLTHRSRPLAGLPTVGMASVGLTHTPGPVGQGVRP